MPPGEPDQPDAPTEPVERVGQSWPRPTAGQIFGAIGVMSGVAALFVSVLALLQDRNGQKISLESKVQIVSVRPDIKRNIPLKLPESEGGPVTTGETDGAAIDIVLSNEYDQPALVNRVKILIKDAADLGSCQGAGALPASVEYDIEIPTEGPIINETFESSNELLTIEGKSLDRLLLSIGPDKIGNMEWGWIYTVSATLHLQSGERLVTGDITLLNAGVNENVKRLAPMINKAEQVGLNLSCVREHRDTLRKFSAGSYPHSNELNSALATLDTFKLDDTADAAPAQPPRQAQSGVNTTSASIEDIEIWVAQLYSVKEQESEEVMQARRKSVEQQIGSRVSVARSSDYSSLKPGFWVGYFPGPFRGPLEVTQWCQEKYLPPDSCTARKLSL